MERYLFSTISANIAPLFIRSQGAIFSDILIKYRHFHQKVYVDMFHPRCWPLCSGINFFAPATFRGPLTDIIKLYKYVCITVL